MTDTFIHLTVEQLEDELFVVTSSDVPGLVAEGRTVREAVEIAQDAARKIAESCIEHGDPLPDALKGIVGNIGREELFVPVSLP
jgi:predicted RNase H-like HicB family nuclease